MPDTNMWLNRAKVLFYGLATASGVVAPSLTMGDLTPDKLALGLVAGALGMLGSWRMNTEVQETSEKDRKRLPETEILLRNHDLNILVMEALKRAITGAADEPGLNGHKKLMQSLAAEVQGHFKDLENAPKDALARIAIPNLALRLKQSEEAKAQTSQHDLAAWEGLLDELAKRSKNDVEVADIRTSLARYIQRVFDPLMVAVFKEDAAGRGPTQGRGWAALTLLFWTDLFSDIRALKEYASSNDEFMMVLLNAEREASAKLDELLRWYPQLATEQKELGEWLRQTHAELLAQLNQIESLIGHGLQSPEEFRRDYWDRRRSDPGLELLWEDADRAEILTGEIVGRAAEVAEFEDFIDPKKTSRMVQFWKGYPGTGKSRLMLEFAERATKAGCRVLFVEKSVHDLDAALRRIKSTEPVVLLWDDYQGNKPDELKTFLDLRRLPQEPLAPPVKRVITAWPSHDVLGEKARAASYEEHELRPIAPDNDDLITYTRRLKKEMSRADARKIVEAADSQPEFVLRALQLVLAGTRPEHLPTNLPERMYDDLVKRVLPEGLAERACVSDALVAVALVGVVNMGNPRQRWAFEAAGVKDAALGRLVERRLVRGNDEAFSLDLDKFRAHVVRRAMDHRRLDVMSGTPQELAKLAAPLLEEWFDGIWRICALAARDAAPDGEIHTELLAAFDARPQSEWSYAKALDVATKLRNSVTFEPDLEQCVALADRITRLRERYDTAEMALMEAAALSTASVGGGSVKDRPELSKEVRDMELGLDLEGLAVLTDSPGRRFLLHDDVIRILEGSLAKMDAFQASYRASGSPTHCFSMAERIGEVRKKHNTPEIAGHEAKALAFAADFGGTANWCLIMAERIAAIFREHPFSNIAGFETDALNRAIELETDESRKNALRERLARLNPRMMLPTPREVVPPVGDLRWENGRRPS